MTYCAVVRRGGLTLIAVLLGGCPDESCEEDVRAQVLDERVELSIDGVALSVELADEAVERERGWRHRTCDLTGILLVPDEPGPLPIFGCELAVAIDVAFVRDGSIVESDRLEPCAPPCGACPLLGEGIEVDAVLEVPIATWDLSPGVSVEGIPP